jgi:phosphoglycolate phosphatase-like HAD superfamily hydrolase
MTPTAIAFDFDGTLIRGGLDKGVHILYASWVACRECGFERHVHPDRIGDDLARAIRAYIRYPGAPRFQQLSAIVNGLVNDRPEAVDDPAALGVGPPLLAAYAAVRECYNRVYSELNDAAAARHWRPFPSVMSTLAALRERHDLYIASGVTQDILERDLDHHGFDRGLFVGIRGGNARGGDDKGQILSGIRARGYRDLLFAGDSNKDLEYAKAGGARFFRIREDGDFARLRRAAAQAPFPDEPDPWDYTEADLAFFRRKAGRTLSRYVQGTPMSAAEITDWINA